jgi:hypothetical protein
MPPFVTLTTRALALFLCLIGLCMAGAVGHTNHDQEESKRSAGVMSAGTNVRRRASSTTTTEAFNALKFKGAKRIMTVTGERQQLYRGSRGGGNKIDQRHDGNYERKAREHSVLMKKARPLETMEKISIARDTLSTHDHLYSNDESLTQKTVDNASTLAPKEWPTAFPIMITTVKENMHSKEKKTKERQQAPKKHVLPSDESTPTLPITIDSGPTESPSGAFAVATKNVGNDELDENGDSVTSKEKKTEKDEFSENGLLKLDRSSTKSEEINESEMVSDPPSLIPSAMPSGMPHPDETTNSAPKIQKKTKRNDEGLPPPSRMPGATTRKNNGSNVPIDNSKTTQNPYLDGGLPETTNDVDPVGPTVKKSKSAEVNGELPSTESKSKQKLSKNQGLENLDQLPSTMPSSMPSTMPSTMPSVMPSIIQTGDTSRPDVGAAKTADNNQLTISPSSMPEPIDRNSPDVDVAKALLDLNAINKIKDSLVDTEIPSEHPSLQPSMFPTSLQPSATPRSRPDFDVAKTILVLHAIDEIKSSRAETETPSMRPSTMSPSMMPTRSDRSRPDLDVAKTLLVVHAIDKNKNSRAETEKPTMKPSATPRSRPDFDVAKTILVLHAIDQIKSSRADTETPSMQPSAMSPSAMPTKSERSRPDLDVAKTLLVVHTIEENRSKRAETDAPTVRPSSSPRSRPDFDVAKTLLVLHAIDQIKSNIEDNTQESSSMPSPRMPT